MFAATAHQKMPESLFFALKDLQRLATGGGNCEGMFDCALPRKHAGAVPEAAPTRSQQERTSQEKSSLRLQPTAKKTVNHVRLDFLTSPQSGETRRHAHVWYRKHETLVPAARRSIRPVESEADVRLRLRLRLYNRAAGTSREVAPWLR